ncbi:CG12744, partial [Drosophila busckii]
HNEQVEHYSIYCFLCQQLFTDIDELQRHLFLHIQQCQQRSQSPKLPSFGCDACGRNLSSEQELQKHRKRFHASTTPRDIVVTYQCDQCDIIYLSLDFLEKHKRLHENGAHTLYNEQHISWQLAKQKYAPRS